MNDVTGTETAAAEQERFRSDPYLIAILKSRFEAVVREMTNVVMKSSRSAVIKNARDLSCAILTYDHKLVSTEEALPIHVTAMEITTRPITELFDDVTEGDIFLNNCPYTGGTHHADMILSMPVFFEGVPLFWVVALSHHADTGAPDPSTYLPYAATLYQEGAHFPCVRVVRNYQEQKDILRIGQIRNRVPQLWLGDLRAQIGACRTGEKRIGELLEKYGRKEILQFVEDWFDYGRKRAIAEIKKLPAGSYAYETRHDPVPGVADEGVPVKIRITVDPVEGEILVDVRDNVDCVPGGLNLSENTCTGSCRIGVFNNLDDSLPHNHGSLSRVRVLMREGSVVGKPVYPVGTSVATTNINDRLIIAGNCVFSKMGAPYGQAESGVHLPMGMAVISGEDPYRDGQRYVNQVFIGYSGGGANHGHDGWLTYCGPANGGLIFLDSVEVDESMYPFVVESRYVLTDSQGPGEWEGAPGVAGVFYPLDHAMTVMYAADATTYPPQGVLGGGGSLPCYSRKQLADGSVVELPAFHKEVCGPEEKMQFFSCGGGGYGDPARRNAAAVARSINKGWLSPEAAQDLYHVKLVSDEVHDTYEVDEAGTPPVRH